MRIRTVKPTLFRHPVVTGWRLEVRWTLVGLYCYLDDEGRGVDDPRLIVADVYPLDDAMTAKKIDQHLAMMALTNGPVCRYTDEDTGTKLLHIVEWNVKGSDFYQLVNRPTKSRLAPCPKHEEPTLFSGTAQ
jgi:hypothetical protein